MNQIEVGSLFRGIVSNVNAYIGFAAGEYGIKPGQFEYFLLISMNPGINQLSLAEKMNVGKSSVTKAVVLLVADDFIYREANSEDKRNLRCFISSKGRRIADTLVNLASKIERHIFQDFSVQEKDEFQEHLQRAFVNSSKLRGT